MKNRTVQWLCGVLCCLLLLPAVFACKKKPAEEGDGGTPGTFSERESGTDGDLYSLTYGDFRILYGENATSDEKSMGANALYDLIRKKTGTLMKVESDYENPVSTYEILVGDTNREGNVSTANLTYYDFGWSFDGEKVRIFGGSAEALGKAVSRFVSKYYDEKNNAVVVSKGLEYSATYSYPYSKVSVGGKDVAGYRISAVKGYEDAANEVYKGFGKLTGVKMMTETVDAGSAEPSGNAILVGYDTTGDLKTGYAVRDGVLRFIGNGESGEFNQLGVTVKKFFEKNFPSVTERQEKDVPTGETETYEISLDNMTYVDDSYTEALDAEFETRRNNILTSESEYKVSGNGKIYYVSNNGDDSRDGLSPETAWKTIGKLNATIFVKGSVVLFERGGVWNKQGLLKLRSGVTYSAYGTGAKPIFSNYADASNASDWIEVRKNIWVYNGKYETDLSVHSDKPLYEEMVKNYPDDPSIPGSYITSIVGEVESRNRSGQDYENCYYYFKETTGASEDVGNIIFTTKDGKTGWGVKMLKYNSKNYCTPLGPCPTGFEGITVTRGTDAFSGGKDLIQNFEFYHDPNECRVYLYYDGGNPGEVFQDIKLVMRGNSASAETEQDSKDLIVDNLAFLYSGVNGMTSYHASNLTIRNCEIGWTGGSIQMYGFLDRDDPTRYGEGVMNWGDCDGFYVLNNYFHQVFDGAISSQQSVWSGLASCIMKNYTVTGNVSEYCSLTFESWMNLTPEQGNNEKYRFENWFVSDNMIRMTGYGFGYTRTDDTSAPMSGSMGWPSPVCINVLITNNIIWDFDDYLLTGLNWDLERYQFTGNTVVHPYGGQFADLARDFDAMAQWDHKMYYYTTEDIGLLLDKKIIGKNNFCFTYQK